MKKSVAKKKTLIDNDKDSFIIIRQVLKLEPSIKIDKVLMSKQSLTMLQNIGKKIGIPFAGFTKHQLIDRIIRYK